MSTHPGRETKSSIQVAVRLPKPMYEALKARDGSVAGQIVVALQAWLERPEPPPQDRPPGPGVQPVDKR
jgi:hypothetical protein